MSTDSNNTSLGNGAGNPNAYPPVSGQNNSSFGYDSNASITDGSANVAVGSYALQNNIHGNYNTSIGTASLVNLNPLATSVSGAGSANTALGSLAGKYDYLGQCNTYLGAQSGQSINDQRTYVQSTAIGYDAKFLTNYPETHQIVIGGSQANVIIPGNLTVLGKSIAGAQGATGAQGNPGKGTNGAQGAQGAQGYTGSRGAGAQGAQGNPGQGTAGAQGAQGNPGQGSAGAQGAQGNPGQGSAGAQGAQGAQGSFNSASNIICNSLTTVSGSGGAQGTVTAVSFSSTSDYRIKDQVIPIVDHDPALTIDKLNPIIYINSMTNKKDMGFLAHEIQEIYPFLVTGEKDGKDTQTVNYIGLIALLVKEIQELKKVLKSKHLL